MSEQTNIEAGRFIAILIEDSYLEELEDICKLKNNRTCSEKDKEKRGVE